MKARTLLELGRVSNLPTVFSNVLCGAALSGERMKPLPLALAVLAGALFYEGGMFLNDALDATIDAKERPERPIPSGRAEQKTVLMLGLGMLAAGEALLGLAALTGLAPSGLALLFAGWATVAAIIVYDRWHKGLAWSPVVMGICRASLYLIGALAVAEQPDYGVWIAAVALLLYVVGLTHIARFENASAVGRAWPTALLFAPVALALLQPIVRVHAGIPTLFLALAVVSWSLRSLGFAWQGGRSIGRAVVTLIAGISLVDALFAASREALGLAAACVVCWALTLGLQRAVRGT